MEPGAGFFPLARSAARLVDICSYLVDDLHSEPWQAGVENKWRGEWKGREWGEVDENDGKKREIDCRKRDNGGSRKASESAGEPARYRRRDIETGRRHVHADLGGEFNRKMDKRESQREGKSGRESVNKRWSWLTSMTRWRSSSPRDWSRGARAPQLPPQDVSEEGPRHVCLGRCLLLITIALSSFFFLPSPSIIVLYLVSSVCPKSWNNVISFQREAGELQQGKLCLLFIYVSRLTTKSFVKYTPWKLCIHEGLSNMYKAVQPTRYDCSGQIQMITNSCKLLDFATTLSSILQEM